MKTSPPLLLAVAALGLSPLHAERPSSEELLKRLGDSARAEALDLLTDSVSPKIRKALDLDHTSAVPAPEPAVKVHIIGDTVFLRELNGARRAIFSSPHHIRGALTSPDGRLIAVSTGTGSAGDSIFFLHRIQHGTGVRYVRENLEHAVRLFIDDVYGLDPRLVRRPSRIFLTPVAVHPGNEFQFAVTGDQDLTGKRLFLTITETGKPILFNIGREE